ncbi:Sec-independent protein translocase subunit TatA [Cellulomonas sp. DKR-3]|uniref:Sec-independent protein translocase protein TatA n=1 Tax=Cellulomonas fulva TaxID=2835530 RepID=A0ABS5TU85_9CELL|nr:Sec-independent protein translocase subunit TatA [Cellulomonas fulva]MBT0992691.1 Sec-independent protein translocase subunit TatA [Cellulomonas fulva]
MLRNLSAWHVIILVGVLILLFGANKLPELARGVGQSMRILKSEVKDLTDDDAPAPAAAQPSPVAPLVAAPDAAAPERPTPTAA